MENNKIPIHLTGKEKNLIELLRKRKIDYGIMECLLHYQDGEIVRVEIEKVRESYKM